MRWRIEVKAITRRRKRAENGETNNSLRRDSHALRNEQTEEFGNRIRKNKRIHGLLWSVISWITVTVIRLLHQERNLGRISTAKQNSWNKTQTQDESISPNRKLRRLICLYGRRKSYEWNSHRQTDSSQRSTLKRLSVIVNKQNRAEKIEQPFRFVIP